MSEPEWAEELAHRQYLINRLMANDAWAPKIRKKVGVILTAHSGGLPFIRRSVESWSKLGYWLTLAYDNFIDPEWGSVDYNRFMPPKDAMGKVDTFVLSHHQTWGGPSYPYCWLVRLAGEMMSHFEYVVVANGDSVLEKPEGFNDLLVMMGEADFMSAGPVLEREIGTLAFIIKGKFLTALGAHLVDHMVPFEEYEKSTQEFGNTEGRMAVAVRELGLTQYIVPEMPLSDQFHIPQGTWYKTIGIRHIHGELNHAYRYGKIPPPLALMDEQYMSSHDLEHLRKFEETKDPEALKTWWSK
jgi:hypothetical protein